MKIDYTNLSFTQLIDEIEANRFFDLPRMAREAFRRLLSRVEALEDAPTPSGGITTLVNTDNNLVITGTEDKTINISPALLSVTNSALQSGDNISELTNDVGYITSVDLPTKTSDLINDGSDATSTYVETDELGTVAFSNDYNDLDNKPTIPTPSGGIESISGDYVDNTDPLNPILGDPRPYRVYTAFLTQSGTNAPVATVLENTLGGDVVWSYDSPGNYFATLTGAFIVGKTTINQGTLTNIGAYTQYFKQLNVIELYTFNNLRVKTDGMLENTEIEIRVYN